MEKSRRPSTVLILLGVVLGLSAEVGADCDILIGRLSGPDPESSRVSEAVFEWVREMAGDSCGLTVELYEDVVTGDDFAEFNSVAIERGAFAMMTGSFRVEGDSVMLDLVLDQIFTNPYLIEDREHFSRPDESMVIEAGQLGFASPVPGFMRFQGYLLAAFAHGRQGLFDTALAEVDLALWNTIGVPIEMVAEAYLFRSQLVSSTSTDYTAGIPDLDTALTIDPGCIRARLAKGYRFELTGETQSALEQYDLAIEMAPSMYKCWKNRANLYSGMGMFAESIADYTMSVELNPEDFESWHYGGVDLRRTRDFQTAYEWLTRALELEPEAAQVWYDRALVNAISELDLEKAMEDLDVALELNPLDWRWYDTAATVWIVRDQWDECIEMAAQGLEVSPREPQLLIDRSVGYMMLMDFDAALTDVEAAIEEATSRSNHTILEHTYTIAEVLRALSMMSPDTPDYWLYVGYAYGEGGYFEEAIEPLSKAIEMNRSLRDAYWLRAANLVEIGIIEQALEDMEKALDLTDDPADREVLQQEIVRIEGL